MATKIIPLIPKHTVYVEPFCGGATILFKKPWPNVTNTDHYREIINDKDSNLINFYHVLRDKEKGPELVERLQLTLYSEIEHKNAKDLESGSDIDRAWAYYVNIRQSFSNALNAGWRRSVYSRNEAATWANKIASLPSYLDRMVSVQVACQDAITIIRQFDSPQTFFYCDPPYPNAHQGHYDGYSIEDFKNLVTALDNCQGSFLLSNYDQPEINIPADWDRFEFSAHASASGRGSVGADRSRKATSEELGNRKRFEVVWRRFNRVPVRPEIQKLYDSGKFDCFASNLDHDILKGLL